jgi:hypothetical protein
MKFEFTERARGRFRGRWEWRLTSRPVHGGGASGIVARSNGTYSTEQQARNAARRVRRGLWFRENAGMAL